MSILFFLWTHDGFEGNTISSLTFIIIRLELIGDLLLRGNGDVKVSINGACGTVQSARLEASSSALVMNSMVR